MEQRSEETYQPVLANRVIITAVVATYNEEAFIGPCLMNLLHQDGLEGEVEILVVDGGSADKTVNIVRSFPEFGDRIRLIENRRRMQVYAWNLALAQARGEYYAMCGAHAEYSPTYFANCLDVMRRTGAQGVGGVARAYGHGFMGRAIAWCMSSPFGIGNARFRYADREQETDSVFALFTRRETLLGLGGFDESLPFDEDSDMNYRMRERGGKIVMSPKIRVNYAARGSLRSLWKQMYRYGYFRRFTQRKHGSRTPLRTYVPAALIAGLAISAGLAATPAVRLLGAAVPAAYALFLLVAALRSAGSALAAAPLVPAALVTMHIAYGWGWWSALLSTLGPHPRKAPGNA